MSLRPQYDKFSVGANCFFNTMHRYRRVCLSRLPKVVGWTIIILSLWLIGGSVCERVTNHSTAENNFYCSPLAIALWGFLALLAVVWMVLSRMWRKPRVLMLHVSLLIILIGALITHLTSFSATLHLHKAEASNILVLPDSTTTYLNFNIRLDSISVKSDEVNDVAVDYMSFLTILPGKDLPVRSGVVSLNRVLDYEGFRFCHNAFDADQGGTLLLVTYDPIGLWVSYLGYALMALSLIAILFYRRSRWLGAMRMLNRENLDNFTTCPPKPSAYRSSKVARLFGQTLFLVAIVLLLVLTTLMAVRWYDRGFIPLTSGSEAMLFMAWLSVLMGIVFGKRQWIVLPVALLTALFSIISSTIGHNTADQVQTQPVLISEWLYFHVMVIMLAYTLLAITCVVSMMALAVIWMQTITKKRNPKISTRLFMFCQFRINADKSIRYLTLLSTALLTPAAAMLMVGIFTGAVWASVSWGAYWQWDQKETWALITLLLYCIPLHLKITAPGSLASEQRGLSLPSASTVIFHSFIVLAFLAVLITYFGVNFFLGGLHSYV